MKKIFLSILVILFYSIKAQTTSTDYLISVKQEIFDSDTCCWRKLSQLKNYKEAAELVVEYLNKSKNITNQHSLNWHAGQLFAMANEKDKAKKYFKKTYSIFYKLFGDDDAKTWYYYAKGTVAFLERDKQKLNRIILKWNKHFPKDKNYKTLEILLEKWDNTYQESLAE